MKAYFNAVATIVLYLILQGCNTTANNEKIRVGFDKVQSYVHKALEDTYVLTDSLKSLAAHPELLQKTFLKARLNYKKAEAFAADYNSDAAHAVNGPPLPVFREDNGRVLPSVGFQAIGELVYDSELNANELIQKIDVTLGFLKLLKETAQKTEINPKRFFLPMHQQLLRIYSLGLSGFDTPTCLAGINESARAFESFKEVYQLALGDTLQYLDERLHNNLLIEIDHAIEYLDAHTDFEAFDRYTFARRHLNPITILWVKVRQKSELWDDPKIYAINLDAPTFFENNSFNLKFFRTSYNGDPTEEQIKLGKKLFFDTKLSSNGKLACATCHKPENSYQDGLVRGLGNDGNKLPRNTPTIVNAIFQKKFFWDGRSDNLEQQITSVFNNEKEFALANHAISSSVLEDEEYLKMFDEAYPQKKIEKKTIIKALSSYTSTLIALDSRFDKNLRGELDDFSDEEIEGMNLFMGKALCATCHFIPLTNGTVPPLFKETEKEILGTPQTAENLAIDGDLGFYWVYEQEVHRYMFKTPTIRNVALTAPYMHNGVYETLDEVMDFYNKGGGAGLGFNLAFQTLPFDSLNLDNGEQKAIIAFMKTFTDNDY